MIKRFSNIFVIMIIMLSLVLFMFSMNDKVGFMFLSVLSIWIANIIYSFTNIKTRISFMLFLISIFVFLMGKEVTLFIKTGNWMNPEYSVLQYKHLFICLYITLMSLLIGYVQTKEYKPKKEKKLLFREQYIVNQRIFFKVLMYFISPIYIYFLFEKIFFVIMNGYTAYYVSFEYSNSFLNSIITQLFYISFYGFLITMPQKKESARVIAIFFVISIISWFTGQRNITILNFMILFWYYVKRDNVNEEERWITKTEKIIFLVAIPCLISFSYLYSFIRDGKIIQGITFFDSLYGFFDSLGNSNAIIIFSKDFKSSFPEPHWRYFFTPLIDLIKENRLSSLIGLSQNLKTNSIEYAFQGYNFGSTLSYLILGNGYLNGGGLGSSYVAEAYFSLGYIGLSVYSILLGYILKKIENILYTSWEISIIGMICFRYLLISPREVALSWIIKGLNFTNIVILLGLYLFFNTVSKRKR